MRRHTQKCGGVWLRRYLDRTIPPVADNKYIAGLQPRRHTIYLDPLGEVGASADSVVDPETREAHEHYFEEPDQR